MAPARRRHRASAVANRRPDPECRGFGFVEQGVFAREQGFLREKQGIFAPLVRLAFRTRRPIEHKNLNMHASPLFAIPGATEF